MAGLKIRTLLWCGFMISASCSWSQNAATGTEPQRGVTSATSEGETQSISHNLPDSPGAVRVASLLPQDQIPSGNASSAGQTVSGQQNSVPAPSAQQPAEKPVGTAVAEPSGASGIAASEPAGAAIAPAKQRRVRTVVLRVGAIIGAGVAVGTVVALTAGTSSKPSGAH
jgi:hypothetical protein